MGAIGYKTKSYKNENYQLDTLAETPEPDTLSKEDIMKQLGYDRAKKLVLGFLLRETGYTHIADQLAQDLREIRKHFFET